MQVVSTVVIPALVIFMMTGVVLHRLDFAAFGTVFFLSQLTVVVALLAWPRRKDRGYAPA